MKLLQRRRSRHALAAILAVTALVASACGSGGSGGSDSAGGGTTVRIGYLHTIAVDDKLWLGQVEGTYKKEGLDIKTTEFDTGIDLSQALAGGSLDVAIMGGVTSNFPAQGQGKIFMVNSIENATSQLWVRKDSGIKSIADLKGKTIVTTQGTTADIFLYNALAKAGMTEKDVKVLNAAMPSAVQSFVGGSADAIALWVPFDLRLQEGDPDVTMLDTAGNYPQAAVADGWIANNDWYASHQSTVKKLIDAWLATNASFRKDPTGSLKKVYDKAYTKDAKITDLQHQVKYQTDYTNAQWLQHYESGDVLNIVGQGEKAFVALGGVKKYVDPKSFFDTSLFIAEAKKAAQ